MIDQDQIVPERYTTYFRSVIAFGKIREVTEKEEMKRILMLLACKYASLQTEQQHAEAIQAEWAEVCVLRLDIEHMSGKQAIELVKD